MFKCKSCGGELVLNIAGQELKCPFCGSTFPASEYSEDNAPQEAETYETTIYTCTQCGAELAAADNAAVTFCSYCGTEAVLEGRLVKEKKPSFIIPFKKNKEECKKIYSEYAASLPYAPKEFTDPEYLERFRGIYIPYWKLGVGFENEPELTVYETYTSGEYDYRNEYRVRPSLKDAKIPIFKDASSGFDDEIAARIAPFHSENMKDFNEAYMAGFFADTADVKPETYEAEAFDSAADQVLKDLAKGFSHAATVSITSSPKERAKILGTKIMESTSAMLPVWFLTWRKGDRLAYGVINGENGKLAADIPVDIGAFLKRSAVIAAILFVASSIASFLLLPQTVLMIASIAALAVHYFQKQEMRAIADRETHANDLGALTGRALEAAANKRVKNRKKKGKYIAPVIVGILIAMMIYGCDSADDRAVTVCLITVTAGLVMFFTSFGLMGRIKEKSVALTAFLPPAAEIVAFGVCMEHPVADWPYYIGSAVTMIVMAFVSIGMIKQFNLLCTRSLPNFHNREGGSKDVGA